MQKFRNQEKGVFRRVLFANMCASLGCGALSAKCTAGPNIRGYVLFPSAWHWTLQKHPSLKPLFLGSWKVTKETKEWLPGLALIAFSHFCLRFGFLSRSLLHISGCKVCRKVVAKCVARSAQVCVTLLPKPLGETPFFVLPIKGRCDFACGRIPPWRPHEPHPTYPHPDPQAIFWPTPETKTWLASRKTKMKKKNQRTMTICVPRFSWGNLGHGHRSSPLQEQLFRGPWLYVQLVFLRGTLGHGHRLFLPQKRN